MRITPSNQNVYKSITRRMEKRNIRKITPSAKTQFDASVQVHVGQGSTNRSGAEASKGSESLDKVKKRSPGRTDVLCGRGGGINNHVGNIAFRELVNTEKYDYNLARDKMEKGVIAERVIGWVKEIGGRFLSKENGMWIEIDHQRELAKTAQALREGAPRIRAKAAKRTLKKKKKEAPKRSTYSSSIYKPFSFRSGLKRGFNSSSATSFRSSNPSSSSSEEHPMIRGYRDGSRGKTLIPAQKKVKVEIEQEHPMIRGSPNGTRGKVFIHPDHARHPTPPLPEPTYEYRERNTPPPPPQEYEYRGQHTPPLPQGQYDFELSEQTPDYSTTSQMYNAPYQDSKPPHFVSEQDSNVPSYFSGNVQVDTFSTQSAAQSIRPEACHSTATYRNPQEAAEDIVKPDILCSRMNSFALSEPENFPIPVINPVDINMSKPTMNFERIHSLVLSEFSGIEFHGDEEFCDPFDSDENAKATQSNTNTGTDVTGAANSHNSANIVEESSKSTFIVGPLSEPVFSGVPPVPDAWNTSSSNSNGNEDVSKSNKVLRYKSSESSSSKLPPFGIFTSSPMTSNRRNIRDVVSRNEHKNGNDNENDNNSSSSNITSVHLKSMKSFYSELSDIKDVDNYKNEEESQDFHEGLKIIYDAVTPGLDEDENVSTHLIPSELLRPSSNSNHLLGF